MRLVSVNYGLPRAVEYDGRPLLTGIFKQPAPAGAAIQVGFTGLEGDGQADLDNHGGIDKAVYAYTLENYAYWQAELGRPDMPYGLFGENLTVEQMPDEAVYLGDQYRIGKVLLQVTQPRVPCFKLGLRLERPDFPQRFRGSGRVGFYLRVLQPGQLRADTVIERVHTGEERLDMQTCMLALQSGPQQQDIIRRVLAAAVLSDAWRTDLERRLA